LLLLDVMSFTAPSPAAAAVLLICPSQVVSLQRAPSLPFPCSSLVIYGKELKNIIRCFFGQAQFFGIHALVI